MNSYFGRTKLTPELVRMIRKMNGEGAFHSEVISYLKEHYGIELKKSAVCDVVKRRTWRNV